MGKLGSFSPRKDCSPPPERSFRKLGVFGCVFACIALALGYYRCKPIEPGRLVVTEDNLVWKPGASDDSSEPARIRFELRNAGGSPVEILSADSSCGCAKPVVTPSLILPHRVASVDVTATPPPVGVRTANIVLTTSVAAQPNVSLMATIHTRRKPPYVITASGNLNFAGKPPAGEMPAVSVFVAAERLPDREPVLKADGEFLRFTLKSHTKKKYPNRDGIFEHHYVFVADFTKIPRRAFFAGVVRVIDPWSLAEACVLGFSVREFSDVRIAPSRLVLRLEGGEPPPQCRVAVLSTKALTDLEVVPVGSGNPVSVEPAATSAAEPTVRPFRVFLAGTLSDRVVEKEHYIEVRTSELPGGKAVVPVRIRVDRPGEG